MVSAISFVLPVALKKHGVSSAADQRSGYFFSRNLVIFRYIFTNQMVEQYPLNMRKMLLGDQSYSRIH